MSRIHHPRDGAGAVGMPGERRAGPAPDRCNRWRVYQIDSCVFYACTANNSKGKRTANLGMGKITPWCVSSWNTPSAQPGRCPSSGYENEEDEVGEQLEVNETRQNVGAPTAECHQADRKVSTKKRIIARTVGLAAGLIEGAPSRLAVEMGRVVDDGTNLCVARSRRTDAWE